MGDDVPALGDDVVDQVVGDWAQLAGEASPTASPPMAIVRILRRRVSVAAPMAVEFAPGTR